LLERMGAAIAHRGPDDFGVFVDGGLALAHRRLSVIDIAGGHQPMVDAERNRVIVYNGEIYNYRELRDGAADPKRFTTNSDTEVLLKSVQLDRFDWLERMNGMYAFALWDARSRTLLLARDRLGVKPLYYVETADELIFASEIKALIVHPSVRRTLNADRVAEYLAFRGLAGPETMFEGVKQLPPGHVMVVSQDRFEPKITQFWSEGRGRAVADYADPAATLEDQLDTLLTDAVRYRLVSDVPVGSFNSGGVDSSLVSAVMRSLTTGPMHTFSVGFEEPEYDERPYAEQVARQLGTEHHALVIDQFQFANAFERALLHFEEPLNHTNTVQLLLLSELARQYVTVILTGEGSDEVFGGYPRLQMPLLAEYVALFPNAFLGLVRRFAAAGNLRRVQKLLDNGVDPRRSIIESARVVPPSDVALVQAPPSGYPAREQVLDRAQAASSTRLQSMLYFEQRTYLPGLLARLDKSSMAYSLECRTPFLDYRVVEWSYKIPDEQKLRVGRDNKRIVKKVAERWLPKEIVYRKKSGFGSPMADWFRNPRGMGRYLDVLTDATCRQRGLLEPSGVEALVKQHLSGRRDHAEALWALVNLELWCRMFIDRNPLEHLASSPLTARLA